MGSPGVRKIDRERLAQLVNEQPDATLKELRERLGIQCAESAICTTLKKLGLSFKKDPSDAANCFRHCGYPLRDR